MDGGGDVISVASPPMHPLPQSGNMPVSPMSHLSNRVSLCRRSFEGSLHADMLSPEGCAYPEDSTSSSDDGKSSISVRSTVSAGLHSLSDWKPKTRVQRELKRLKAQSHGKGSYGDLISVGTGPAVVTQGPQSVCGDPSPVAAPSAPSAPSAVFASMERPRSVKPEFYVAPEIAMLVRDPIARSEAMRYLVSVSRRKELPPWRRQFTHIVTSKLFNRAVLALIFANCIFLALDDPTRDEGEVTARSQIVDTSEYVFTAAFTIEMGMRILGLGFISGSQAYLRDWWNVMDMVIVLSALSSMVVELSTEEKGAALSSVRGLRLLRPLRVASQVEQVQIIVSSLFQSLPQLADVMLLYILFLTVFGIMAIQLWKGKLSKRCMTDDGLFDPQMRICTYDLDHPYSYKCPWNYSCVEYGNPNYGKSSFDNIGVSVLTLFTGLTLEGWTDVMYDVVDATTPFASLYFLFVVMVGTFFIINLTLAIINTSFEANVKQTKESKELARLQEGRVAGELRRYVSLSKGPILTLGPPALSPPCSAPATPGAAPAAMLRQVREMSPPPPTPVEATNSPTAATAAPAAPLLHPPPRISVVSPQAGPLEVSGTAAASGSGSPERQRGRRVRPAVPPLTLPTVHSSSPRPVTPVSAGGAPSTFGSIASGGAPRSPGLGVPGGGRRRAASLTPSHGGASATTSLSWGAHSHGGNTSAASCAAEAPSSSASASHSGAHHRAAGSAGSAPVTPTAPLAEVAGFPLGGGGGGGGGSGQLSPQAGSASHGAQGSGGGSSSISPYAGGGGAGGGSLLLSPLGAAAPLRLRSDPSLGSIEGDAAAAEVGLRGVGRAAGGVGPVEAPHVILTPPSSDMLYATAAAELAAAQEQQRQRQAAEDAAAAAAPPAAPAASQPVVAASAPAEQAPVRFESFDLPERDSNSEASSSEGGSGVWGRLRRRLRRVVDSVQFNYFVLCLVAANTIIMATEHYGQPEALTSVQEVSHYIFTFLFAAEVVLKVVALPWRVFLHDGFNLLDTAIVLTALADLFLVDAERFDLSALRAFRLMTSFKLAAHNPMFSQLWVFYKSLEMSVIGASVLTALLMLVLFIYALLGMQFFGGKFCGLEPGRTEGHCEGTPRANFDSMLPSLLAVFQIVTGEDWNMIMYNGMRATHDVASIYFVTLVFIGNYLVLNLFVAVLFSGLSAAEEADGEVQCYRAGKTAEELATAAQGGASGNTHTPRGCCSRFLDLLCTTVCRRPSRESVEPVGAAYAPGAFNTPPAGPSTLHPSRLGEGGGEGGGAHTRSAQLFDPDDDDDPALAGTVPHPLLLPNGIQTSPRSATGGGPEARLPPAPAEQAPRRPTLQQAVEAFRPYGVDQSNAVQHEDVLPDQLALMLADGVVRSEAEGAALFRLLVSGHDMSPEGSPVMQDVGVGPAAAGDWGVVAAASAKPGGGWEGMLTPGGGAQEEGEQAGHVGIALPPPPALREGFAENANSISFRTNNADPASLGPRAASGASAGSTEYGDFLLLPGDNPLRQRLRWAVEHSVFEGCVLATVLLSSVSLALEDPIAAPDTAMPKALETIDLVVVALFTAEACLKILAYGFIGLPRHRGTYLRRDAWNRLDFFIVVCGVVSLALKEAQENGSAVGAIEVVRTMRTLRPLRAVSKSVGMRLVLKSLLGALPSLSHVFIISVLILMVFGIIGVQFFAGKFYACTDVQWNDHPNITTRAHCELTPSSVLPGATLRWESHPSNFDNLGNAVVTLFTIATLEGWVEAMYLGMDSVDVDVAPQEHHRPWMCLYFVVFVVLGAFFLVNLFTGVLVDKYEKERRESDEAYQSFLSNKQQEYKLILDLVAATVKPLSHPMVSSSAVQKLQAMVLDPNFDRSIMFCIVLNTVVMALEHSGQSHEWDVALLSANVFFIVVFTLEAVAKIITMSPADYMQDHWNKFDFAVLIVSIAGLIFTFLNTEGPALSVFRVLRVARLLRAVRIAAGLRTLVRTLILSLRGLINVAGLLAIFFFVYAVIGVRIFGRVTRGEYLTDQANFDNFGNAALLLFRMCTGEGWQGVMHDTQVSTEPSCDSQIDSCGSPVFARFYFVSFMLVGTFIILNLIVAVILEDFLTAQEEASCAVTADDIELFMAKWNVYDSDGTGFIDVTRLESFISSIGPPLGFKERTKRSHKGELGLIVRDIFEHNGKVHFRDVLMGCCRTLVYHEFCDTTDDFDLPRSLAMRYERRWAEVFPTLPKGGDLVEVYKSIAAMRIQTVWRRKAKRNKLRLARSALLSDHATLATTALTPTSRLLSPPVSPQKSDGGSPATRTFSNGAPSPSRSVPERPPPPVPAVLSPRSTEDQREPVSPVATLPQTGELLAELSALAEGSAVSGISPAPSQDPGAGTADSPAPAGPAAAGLRGDALAPLVAPSDRSRRPSISTSRSSISSPLPPLQKAPAFPAAGQPPPPPQTAGLSPLPPLQQQHPAAAPPLGPHGGAATPPATSEQGSEPPSPPPSDDEGGCGEAGVAADGGGGGGAAASESPLAGCLPRDYSAASMVLDLGILGEDPAGPASPAQGAEDLDLHVRRLEEAPVGSQQGGAAVLPPGTPPAQGGGGVVADGGPSAELEPDTSDAPEALSSDTATPVSARARRPKRRSIFQADGP